MLFSNRISASAWATTTRLIRVGLEAGLGLPDVVRKQAIRGPYSVRPLMSRLADRLDTGDSLGDALAPEAGRVPPLVVAALSVGEESGNLAEAFRDLEEYYELQNTLKRNFLAQIFLPMLQLVGVVIVLTLFLLVLGWFNLQMDPLGLGTGWPAVLKLWTIVGVAVVGIWMLFRGFSRQLRFLAPVERLILSIPGLGGALSDILLGRFSMGLKMTLGSGMGVKKALNYSFDAAASALYKQSFERAKDGIRRGDSVHNILKGTNLFPSEYLDIIANAEDGGQIPEVMTRVAKNYLEDAARKLRVITQFAAVFIYFCVAALIISLIIRIYSNAIAPAYNMKI